MIKIRNANRSDAMDLAHLVNMAGYGLAYHLWSEMAKSGQDPWDVGRQRAGREEGSFAWTNAQIAEMDGAVAAGIVSYDIGLEPEAIEPGTSEAIAALIELENQVLGSFYINVLAVYPEFQGKGLGRKLLRSVQDQAQGKAQSLIVDRSNTGALGLYQSEGFYIKDSRPVGPTPWNDKADDWLLMVKPQS